jgi:hypothetical protein
MFLIYVLGFSLTTLMYLALVADRRDHFFGPKTSENAEVHEAQLAKHGTAWIIAILISLAIAWPLLIVSQIYQEVKIILGGK